MSDNPYVFVQRPELQKRHKFANNLRQTLHDGTALQIPLDGETYAVVRNRKAGTAYPVAEKLHASVRTIPSADGKYLLIWLEPRATPAKAEGQ